MADQWPRAVLRATLREIGYDALGARDLVEALLYPAAEVERGPVRLVILDHGVVQGAHDVLLARLLGRHRDPATLLLASAMRPPLEGPWRRVIQRPTSIADIVQTVQLLLPLPPTAAHPID